MRIYTWQKKNMKTIIKKGIAKEKEGLYYLTKLTHI